MRDISLSDQIQTDCQSGLCAIGSVRCLHNTCSGHTSRHLQPRIVVPNAPRCRTWHSQTMQGIPMPAGFPSWVRTFLSRQAHCVWPKSVRLLQEVSTALGTDKLYD